MNIKFTTTKNKLQGSSVGMSFIPSQDKTRSDYRDIPYEGRWKWYPIILGNSVDNYAKIDETRVRYQEWTPVDKFSFKDTTGDSKFELVVEDYVPRIGYDAFITYEIRAIDESGERSEIEESTSIVGVYFGLGFSEIQRLKPEGSTFNDYNVFEITGLINKMPIGHPYGVEIGKDNSKILLRYYTEISEMYGPAIYKHFIKIDDKETVFNNMTGNYPTEALFKPITKRFVLSKPIDRESGAEVRWGIYVEGTKIPNPSKKLEILSAPEILMPDRPSLEIRRKGISVNMPHEDPAITGGITANKTMGISSATGQSHSASLYNTESVKGKPKDEPSLAFMDSEHSELATLMAKEDRNGKKRLILYSDEFAIEDKDGTYAAITPETLKIGMESGKDAYLYIAYANLIGDEVNDFSTTDSRGRNYIGFYSTNRPDQPGASEAYLYAWSLYKGSDGEKGDPGEDGYSVVLSSDSCVFQGNTTNAFNKTITIKVYALKGATPISYTVGNITGQKTGLTATVTNGDIVIKATTQLKESGELSIPIRPSGSNETILKKFTYTVALRGRDGAQGAPGKDGKSIRRIDVEYQSHTSQVSPPGNSGWSTDTPSWKDGEFIWTRTVVYYTDGDKSVSDAACITGPKGEDGSSNSELVDITRRYYLSNSNTSIIGGSWLTKQPTWVPNKYLWTQDTLHFRDGSQKKATAILDATWAELGNVGRGGTNLLIGSNRFKMPSVSSGENKCFINEDKNLVFVVENSSVTYSNFLIETTDFSYKLDIGEEYVISFTLRKDGSETQPPLIGVQGISTTRGEGKIKNRFSQITLSKKWTSESFNLRLRFPSAGTYYLKDIKIEKGTTPTFWSPAPEDLQLELDDLESKVNESIKENSDSLLSKINPVQAAVEDHKKWLTEQEQSAKEIAQKVNELETRETKVLVNVGDGKLSIVGLENSLEVSPDGGIFLGDVISKNGIMITDDRISFLQGTDSSGNGIEVAHVTGQSLMITKGVFLQDLTIGIHRMESIKDRGVTIFSYVG